MSGKYVITRLFVVMTSTFVLPILDLDHHQKIDKNQEQFYNSVLIINRESLKRVEEFETQNIRSALICSKFIQKEDLIKIIRIKVQDSKRLNI